MAKGISKYFQKKIKSNPDDYDVPELRKYLKVKGVKGISTMVKKDLIEMVKISNLTKDQIVIAGKKKKIKGLSSTIAYIAGLIVFGVVNWVDGLIK